MSTALESVAPAVTQMLPLAEVLILLFVTLGPPIKVPAAYLMMTRALPEPEARALATKAFLFAVVAAIGGGLVGVLLMGKWHLSPAVLQLTGGIVFFLVSLQAVMGQYQPPPPAPAPAPSEPPAPLKAFGVAVPLLVTPYGLTAIIVMMARSPDLVRTASIAGLVLVIMVLNLLAMRYARPIMRTIGPIPLQLFGTIVGVMTIGLSLKLIAGSLRGAGLIG